MKKNESTKSTFTNMYWCLTCEKMYFKTADSFVCPKHKSQGNLENVGIWEQIKAGIEENLKNN